MAGFTFTPEQQAEVRQLQADKGKWERVVANATERLTDINAKLNAVAVLNGGTLNLEKASSLEEANMMWAAEEANDNMTGAIEAAVNAPNAWPLSHTAMREILRKKGFPEDRLGNYYYTAVHRLKGKGRIAINDQKMIVRVGK